MLGAVGTNALEFCAGALRLAAKEAPPSKRGALPFSSGSPGSAWNCAPKRPPDTIRTEPNLLIDFEPLTIIMRGEVGYFEPTPVRGFAGDHATWFPAPYQFTGAGFQKPKLSGNHIQP